MKLSSEQLNTATFVGFDLHPDTHTVLAMNRFKEPKGNLTFPNSKGGIEQCIAWLEKVEPNTENVIIGLEGGGHARHALVLALLEKYHLVFEVNPLFTKHRRNYGTKRDKNDLIDAKLVAGVLTTELEELPRITPEQLTSDALCLKKSVWFYEEVTVQGTRLKNQLYKLKREHKLTKYSEEKQLLAEIIKVREQELAFVEKTKYQLEKKLKKIVTQGQNLLGIRGIGPITVAQVVSHTDTIGRFSNREEFVRYAGIAPVEFSSGKDRDFIQMKRGNRKLNTVFYLAAWHRIIHDPKIKEIYEQKIASGKTKELAHLYVMRKTAILLYSLLKSGEAYRV